MSSVIPGRETPLYIQSDHPIQNLGGAQEETAPSLQNIGA